MSRSTGMCESDEPRTLPATRIFPDYVNYPAVRLIFYYATKDLKNPGLPNHRIALKEYNDALIATG